MFVQLLESSIFLCIFQVQVGQKCYFFYFFLGQMTQGEGERSYNVCKLFKKINILSLQKKLDTLNVQN